MSTTTASSLAFPSPANASCRWVAFLFLCLLVLSDAFTSPNDVPLNHNPAPSLPGTPSAGVPQKTASSSSLTPSQILRQNWVEKSVNYYSKVMREERRRSMGQEIEFGSEEDLRLATKHYFALQKIKEGRHRHAEIIYRQIIEGLLQELQDEPAECDHSKLAVTTLLLALHCQRMGELKKARSVFLTFFRVAVVEHDEEDGVECACSAKVLGAYALFEFKQGNAFKSLEIAKKAAQYDDTLSAVLNWKQFRDVELRRSQQKVASR